MTTPPHTTFPHIVRDPEIVGGEPTIKGTRIPVRSVAIVYDRSKSIEEVCASYPRLTPEIAQEALAFYAANKAEIDGYIEENERGAYAPGEHE